MSGLRRGERGIDGGRARVSKGDRQTDLHVNLFTFYSRKFLLDLHIFLDFYRNWRLVVQAHSQCQWQCRRYPILPELRVSVSVSVSAKLREIVTESERDGGMERYGVKAAAVARNDVAYFARFSTIFVQFSASSHIDYTVENWLSTLLRHM